MLVQRNLLLLIFFLFFLAPLIEDWVVADPLHWYRPYLVWAGVIVLMLGIQRSANSHDL